MTLINTEQGLEREHRDGVSRGVQFPGPSAGCLHAIRGSIGVPEIRAEKPATAGEYTCDGECDAGDRNIVTDRGSFGGKR